VIVDAGRAEDLAPGQMKRIERDGAAAIALFNVAGALYATQDACTHARSSLTEEGRLTDNVIECGWHFGTFDVSTGRALSAPCSRPLRTFATAVVDGRVLIDVPDAPRMPALHPRDSDSKT
jgi:p-cumate 2,3-dioxygenase ferredoxin subunit